MGFNNPEFFVFRIIKNITPEIGFLENCPQKYVFVLSVISLFYLFIYLFIYC